MRDRLLEMLHLQDRVNSLSTHENWREGMTLTGQIINWKRCIYMETAEAIDSVSWKHWKNIQGGIDKENLDLELIDIWHFLMSYLLTQDSITDVLEMILDNMNWNFAEVPMPNELNEANNLLIDSILAPYEALMSLSLEKRDDSEYKKDFIKNFFMCLDSAGISFDVLYQLYIWKNVLNKFRQDNGYRLWTYIKVWGGEEDNMVMQRILWDITWFDNIYNELHRIYHSLEKE